MVKAGFSEVAVTEEILTMFGTMILYRAIKPY